MIRYDGYYETGPIPYEDGIANYSIKGFFHHAYLFSPDGTYIKTTKKSSSDEYQFEKSDFNSEFQNKYEVRGNNLIITYYTGEKWEFSEDFVFESTNVLQGKDRRLCFVGWL